MLINRILKYLKMFYSNLNKSRVCVIIIIGIIIIIIEVFLFKNSAEGQVEIEVIVTCSLIQFRGHSIYFLPATPMVRPPRPVVLVC